MSFLKEGWQPTPENVAHELAEFMLYGATFMILWQKLEESDVF